MVYLPPRESGASASALAGFGPAIAIGSAVAIGCAFVVGLFGGVTGIQSTLAAILLGRFVGLAVRRNRCDSLTAIGGAIIALAGSALASLIAVTIRIIREAHVPLAAVLAQVPRLISVMPHVIGWFGFLCWALATYLGWVTIARGGQRRGPASPSATAS